MAAMSFAPSERLPTAAKGPKRGVTMQNHAARALAPYALGLAVAWWSIAPPLARAAGAANVNLGPYNVRILAGGVGLSRPLAPDSPLLAAGAPWSLSGWVNLSIPTSRPVIAAIGDVPGNAWRGLELRDGKLALVSSSSPAGVSAAADTSPLGAARW